MIGQDIQDNICKRIHEVAKPLQILLFGSHVHGTATPQSDIDLLVVLDSDDAPKSFKERNAQHLKISRALRELERNVPIDLLVYTRPEFEQFLASQSIFSKRVLSEAVRIS